MIITLHASTPAEAIAKVVKEIRRRAGNTLAQLHSCHTNAQRNITLARANELNNLADFFSQVIVEPPTQEPSP